MRKLMQFGAALAVVAMTAGIAIVAGNTQHTQAADGETVWNITIENLTSGQPFSPPVVVVHDSTADVFEVGEAASAGVQTVAEMGSPTILADALKGTDGVYDVAIGSQAPILGGDSVTLMVSGPSGSMLSIVSMLSCTNDGFNGLDSWALPASGTDTTTGIGYDAGTEPNSELSEDLVDGCGVIGPVALPADGNAHTDEGGVVAVHPGITGSGDLTTTDHGWTDPTMMVTAQVMPTVTYNVAIDNLTTGQLFSPPVIAAHSADGHIFEMGEAASPGLQTVAETGNPTTLLAELNASPYVYNASVLASAPLMPGTRLTATFDAPAGSLISLAAMLGCTNDGFVGLNSVALGSGIDAMANSYDAGTEVNTESAADLTGLCGSAGPVTFVGLGGHVDENGVVMSHPGIQGIGVLTSAHSWTDPVARIQITTGDVAPPPATATPTATTAAPTATATSTTVPPTATATQPAPTSTATAVPPGPPNTGSGIDGGNGSTTGWVLALGAALLALGGGAALVAKRTTG